MTHAGYVAVGWISTIGVIVLFAWLTLRRGRARSGEVPAEERRWS